MGLFQFNANHNSTEVSRPWIGEVIQIFDLVRIFLLRLTMQIPGLQTIYSVKAIRLGLSFLFFTALYFVISLKFSLMLLVLGPMVLGYPHLIASFRFLHKNFIVDRFQAKTVFKIFSILTLISLIVRFFLPKVADIPQLPYGFFEIGLSIAAIALIVLKINSAKQFLISTLSLLTCAGLLYLGWFDPLAFIGFALILHNWVAFGHWYLSAKDWSNKLIAVGATLIFACIHLIVILGYVDSQISIAQFEFLSTKTFEINGWALAPWSSSQMVWDRMIVLYTFGLSIHYFVWLQAIPQCLDQNSKPNSFRRTYEILKNDCGHRMTMMVLCGALLLMALWIFTAYAGRFYFGLALLHGWLELAFLIVASVTGIVGRIWTVEN